MEQEIGDKILQETRDAYRENKPVDKHYVLTGDQENDAALRAKAARRNQLNDDIFRFIRGDYHGAPRVYMANPSFFMASFAAQKAHESQYTTTTCDIDTVYSTHTFCVADFYQRDNLPKCLQDIVPNEYNRSAWVIDPWMNISCRYTDYKSQVLMKFMKWSAIGKHVTRFRIDPALPNWISLFFTGQLQIGLPREPELRAERFLTTKRARGRLLTDEQQST